MQKIYCMVIGDLVSSKKIDSNTRANIQVSLKRTLEKINFDYDKYICSKFSVTLGDELQGGLYDIYPLFDILDRIKRSISPCKIRFGVGIDTMTTEIQYHNSLGSDGIAYHYARNAVEGLKKCETNEYGYRLGSSIANLGYANDMFELIDCISQDWTEVQKKYIYRLQENPELELSIIAKAMNVNVSSVSRAISKSNYKLVSKVLKNLSQKIGDELFLRDPQNLFQVKYNEVCRLFDLNQLGDYKTVKEKLCPPTTNEEAVDYYSLLSLIYNAHFSSDEAIEYANKAIAYASEAIRFLDNNSKSKKIRLLNILGISYTNKKCYELAEKSFREAEQILDISESAESWKMYTWGNLARLFSVKGDYPEAERLFRKVQNILEEFFPYDERSKLTLQSSFAKLYFRWEKYDISLQMYQSANLLADSMNNRYTNSSAIVKFHYAELLMKTEGAEFLNIYQLLKDAADIFKRNKDTEKENWCYELLYDLCKKHGENLKAEEFRERTPKIKEES